MLVEEVSHAQVLSSSTRLITPFILKFTALIVLLDHSAIQVNARSPSFLFIVDTSAVLKIVVVFIILQHPYKSTISLVLDFQFIFLIQSKNLAHLC